MPPDLEIALLRAFVASARAGSISRAAAAVGQTQPAVSQKLRRLERTLGQPLLLRATSGVSLTNAGEALLPYAERILALSAEALSDLGQSISGQCGVGLAEDIAAAHLPQFLVRFAKVHPHAKLEVMVGSGPALRQALKRGRIQIALCDVRYMQEPPRWSLPFPLVWAVDPSVDLSADTLPLVLFSRPCLWRSAILESIDGAGRSWKLAFESTSLAGVKAAVQAGLGAAPMLPVNVVPELRAPYNHPGLPPLPTVEIGLIRRSGTEGDPLVDAIDDALRRLV
ncbi:LysR family transcriptional regulator [Kribbella sp. VKM Ac-2566]|uniref:LysR substrate-binding domain-containing protein n=1 Tax=Kribbella sp. VKM Ac-2566 TaxID=2512218 RepID=UPI00106373A4|nr:LysR family transcriptional regulator [Kribbella sp. VKM Ac-2566]TDX08293.1 DNA-binding transcriptional LysR family regulator [Kribbella sp. VKM Ac-2566]